VLGACQRLVCDLDDLDQAEASLADVTRWSGQAQSDSEPSLTDGSDGHCMMIIEQSANKFCEA
jgi:hypothetical protein